MHNWVVGGELQYLIVSSSPLLHSGSRGGRRVPVRGARPRMHRDLRLHDDMQWKGQVRAGRPMRVLAWLDRGRLRHLHAAPSSRHPTVPGSNSASQRERRVPMQRIRSRMHGDLRLPDHLQRKGKMRPWR